MRIFLAVLVLIFSLQSWAKADDIKEFEIEGMSVGDSLLDYFSEEEINKRKIFYYPNSKKFVGISFANQDFYKTFDAVQFAFDENSKKIYSIGGEIYFKNNIDGCLKKKDEIVNHLSSMFDDNKVKIKDKNIKHPYDKSGKSKVIAVYFEFHGGSAIKVNCYDWQENFEFEDSLILTINTYEYRKFLSDEAY